MDLSYGAAKALIEEGQLDRLLAADQLRAQMGAGRVFEGFEEAPINFNPTYKFDVGSSVYDTRYIYIPLA